MRDGNSCLTDRYPALAKDILPIQLHVPSLSALVASRRADRAVTTNSDN